MTVLEEMSEEQWDVLLAAEDQWNHCDCVSFHRPYLLLGETQQRIQIYFLKDFEENLRDTSCSGDFQQITLLCLLYLSTNKNSNANKLIWAINYPDQDRDQDGLISYTEFCDRKTLSEKAFEVKL